MQLYDETRLHETLLAFRIQNVQEVMSKGPEERQDRVRHDTIRYTKGERDRETNR